MLKELCAKPVLESMQSILDSIKTDIESAQTIKDSKDKDTLKSFIEYKLKYLKGLLNSL